jgi:glycosyltransferase involved in cell wall biosynthesis
MTLQINTKRRLFAERIFKEIIKLVLVSVSFFLRKVSCPSVERQVKGAQRITKLAMVAIRRNRGWKSTLKKAIQLYCREGLAGIRRRLIMVAKSGQVGPTIGSGEFDRNDYAEWISRYDAVTDQIRAKMRAVIGTLPAKPIISVVMPVYNPNSIWLERAIESVRQQIYPHWELCIADDASTDKAVRPILERYAKEDSRIKIIFREKNGHISAASNSALGLATGLWVALLDHDDLLAEHALFWVVDAINRNPAACLIYSDEDKIDNLDRRFDPYFKCDWNVDLFYSHNMFSHLGVYRADLLHDIGGFREGLEGSQDYDLALHCIERIEPNQIHHIPRVLYHWRAHTGSTAQSGDAKPYAMLAGKRALNDHFHRQSVNARAELVGFGYRVRYTPPGAPPLVSIIIPTRNGYRLIKQCVKSILEKTSYPHYELLLIDNGSDDLETIKYFNSLKNDARVRILHDDRPFNYSALNNAAVKVAEGEIVALLNSDIEVISPEWLSELVSHAMRPSIGAVGARLWYPDNTVQHAGVILGLGEDRVGGHPNYRMPRGQHGYFGRASLTQSFSAVTAACLVIRKSVYEEIGGFDEVNLQVAFNDIDFCLRVRGKGYRNVWTPYAELYHRESASRGYENTQESQRFAKEAAYMKQRWGDTLLNDPAYSPNLTLDHEDFSLAWPPRVDLLASPHEKAAQQSQLSRIDKAPFLTDRKELGDEIGPSHNPLTPKKAFLKVHILDHSTREELTKQYRCHAINLNNIEKVNFIWRGEPFQELIGKTSCYHWNIASHVIEHVPDMISFLQQCEILLKPSSILSSVILDKRYCSDYFFSSSFTGNARDAHAEKRGTRSRSHQQFFDYSANAAGRNDKSLRSSGENGVAGELHNTFAEAQALWERSISTTDYIDTHCWRFTAASFHLLISDLDYLGLIGLKIRTELDTSGCYFSVSPGKKDDAPFKLDRLAILQERKLEDARVCGAYHT